MSAQQSRTDWSLHAVAGRVPMLEGEFGLDRAWSPQGQGRYVMPLASYEALHANRASNPSFDANANGWYGWANPVRMTGDPIAGSYGRSTAVAGNPEMVAISEAPVTPGSVWDVRLERFRTPNLASKWAELTVVFYSSSRQALASVVAPRVRLFAYWQESLALSGVRAPADAATIAVELRVRNTSGGSVHTPSAGQLLDLDGLSLTPHVLRGRQRDPVLLVGEVWLAYSDGLGTLALSGAGSTLGGATWPAPVAGDHYLPYSGTVIEARPRAVAWHVWPREVTIDEGEQTVTIELATVEALLQDATNLSGSDIEPARSASGSYHVGRMLVRLAAQVGVQVLVPAGGDFTVATVEPWKQGQTLWDWFTRVRSDAGLGYLLDAQTNTIALYGLVGAWPYGAVSTVALERSSRIGTASAQGLEFADALTLTWRWIDGGVEQVSTETVVASSLSSWQAATKAIELDRAGPPQAGVAQRIVDNLARLRKVTTVVAPTNAGTLQVTPLRLDGENWQAVRYGFDNELATITILEP